MRTFDDEFQKGSYVRVIDPSDMNYESEASVIKFDVHSGEYVVEFVSGDSKGSQKHYSAADLVQI